MTEMETKELVSSMQDMLEQLDGEYYEVLSRTADPTPNLFGRVPSHLREDDWRPFDPKVVSIGPLHMGKPELEPMQKIKWVYMRMLLERHPGAGVSSSTSEPELPFWQRQVQALNPYLNKCVSVVRGLEESARRYYGEEFLQLDKNEFTRMLLLDACFLIELCCHQHHGDDINSKKISEFGEQISREVLLHDLLLIENQIPFDVLSTVYLSIFPSLDNKPDKLVVGLRKFLFPNEDCTYSIKRTYVNLLEFYCENLHRLIYQLRIPTPMQSILLRIVALNRTTQHNTAIECVEAGIHIRATHRRSCIPRLVFINGTLAIQRIHMNDLTYSKIRNITLAEGWRSVLCPVLSSNDRPMTEYVHFLCSLIESEADYKVLEEKGIVSADSIKEGMLMFHKLKRLPLPKLMPSDHAWVICQEIERYVAIRVIFGSPLSFIGLVGCFAFLGISALQTIFTILRYYNKN